MLFCVVVGGGAWGEVHGDECQVGTERRDSKCLLAVPDVQLELSYAMYWKVRVQSIAAQESRCFKFGSLVQQETRVTHLEYTHLEAP